MTNEDLIVRQKMKIENMSRALKIISDWDLPKAEHKGDPCSYESAYGSNGARDYIKHVAKEALEYRSDHNA